MNRVGVKGALAASFLVIGLSLSGCATSGDITQAQEDSKEALRVANEANAKATAAAADAAAARAAADAAAEEAKKASEKSDRIFQRSLHK